MDGLSENYLSHIGRVAVSFYVSAPDLNPERVTAAIGLQPHSTAKKGDERSNYAGQVISPHKKGHWKISTKGKLTSKDVNEHFSYLLGVLLPHKQTLVKLIHELNGESDFDVLWESNYLYAGTGPLLSRETITGVGQLEAAIGFDIYQIEQQDNS